MGRGPVSMSLTFLSDGTSMTDTVPVVAVADEGIAVAVGKGDLVMALAGGNECQPLERVRVDDGDAALIDLGTVVADPEVALVALQLEAGGLLAGVQIFNDLEGIGVDQGDLVGLRHADEQPLVVLGLDPVGARLVEVDLGEEVGDAGDAHLGVDHRDRVVPVQDQQVLVVEVDHRPHADDALQVQRDPVLAFHDLVAQASQALVRSTQAAGKLPCRGVPLPASVMRKVTSAQSPATSLSDSPFVGRIESSTLRPWRMMRLGLSGSGAG